MAAFILPAAAAGMHRIILKKTGPERLIAKGIARLAECALNGAGIAPSIRNGIGAHRSRSTASPLARKIDQMTGVKAGHNRACFVRLP
jgi:hypothetical protein